MSTVAKQLGRFTIFEDCSPPMPPGKCAICGSVHGDFIDFNFDLDFYGVVYFCSQCFGEAIEAFQSEKITKLQNKLEYCNNAINLLEAENKELRDALGVIDRARTVYVDNNQLALFSVEDGEHNDGDSEGSESGSEESDSGSDESSTKSGRTDVRDDDELTKLLTDI